MPESAADSELGTFTIHELLTRSAESILELQRSDGSFPPGRNYTYDEPETPVRTTSHWAVTLSEVYDFTGRKQFQDAANDAIDYLLSDEVRPHGYTFHCRDADGLDKCNGLIGQAYPIRALAHAGSILGRNDAIEVAIDVFDIHPFNSELGLWERVEITGEKISFDRTLNHQIIFASGCSTLASESTVVHDRISEFLDSLESNMRLHSDGIIKHYIRPPIGKILPAVIQQPRHWPLVLNEVVFHYYSISEKRKQKEIRYHPTNLKGLSKLRMRFPDHSFWDDKKTRALLQASSSYQKSFRNSEGHGSVIPGICLALAAYGFENDVNRMKKHIERDLQDSLDHDTYLLQSSIVEDIEQSAGLSHLVDLENTTVTLRERK